MNNKSMITVNEPSSLVAEQYKMVRTNLSFSNVDTNRQVILFTSSMAEEGKTTTICNMAVTFALSGKKTLLIECDLRKARIHQLFEIPQMPGLTNLLTEKKQLDEIVQKLDGVDNLYVLTAGALPPAPAELLCSQTFEKLIDTAREAYDVILIDAPPILSVTDAVIISKMVDGVILVVAAAETKKDAIRQSKKALDKVGANLLGVILTKVDFKKSGYYYAYNGYYGGDGKKKKRFFSRKLHEKNGKK